jgi:hypothetical protein
MLATFKPINKKPFVIFNLYIYIYRNRVVFMVCEIFQSQDINSIQYSLLDDDATLQNLALY